MKNVEEALALLSLSEMAFISDHVDEMNPAQIAKALQKELAMNFGLGRIRYAVKVYVNREKENSLTAQRLGENCERCGVERPFDCTREALRQARFGLRSPKCHECDHVSTSNPVDSCKSGGVVFVSVTATYELHVSKESQDLIDAIAGKEWKWREQPFVHLRSQGPALFIWVAARGPYYRDQQEDGSVVWNSLEFLLTEFPTARYFYRRELEGQVDEMGDIDICPMLKLEKQLN